MRRRVNLIVASASLLLLAACGSNSGSGDDAAAWKKPFDPDKVAAEMQHIKTLGLPDDWANYGAVIQAMCEKYDAEPCVHKDSDMSSAEEIRAFDSQKGNPVGTVSDIGAVWGTTAEKAGVLPDYLPPNADGLKPSQKAATGGWVNSFTGTIAFTVNTDVVKDPPTTWKDLLDPKYDNQIAAGNFGSPTGGEGQAGLFAIAYAFGGDENHLDPAYDYIRKLILSGNLTSTPYNTDLMIKGEVPINVGYDFNAISDAEKAKAAGVHVKVIIPSDGSVYAPLSLMINKYNTDNMDFEKAFMDFILSDEGQLLFADYGARPIRYVNGDLKIPASRRTRWLPDSAYANTKTIDVTKIDPQKMIADYTDEVLD